MASLPGGGSMQLYFANRRKVWKVGEVAGLGRAELTGLIGSLVLAGFLGGALTWWGKSRANPA
ncbi:hypothetical protein AB0N06_29820 [Streptomyces sp. NPDC051020]|uniref:hypothetical protein n=1 Tax=Streptomyces sp. NPDC051020 TaxID=3155409 RepID=UPI003439819B